MDSKSTIFIVLGSLLIMAIFSSIMNFVSAPTVTTCENIKILGGSICTTFHDDRKETYQYCYKDKNGIGNCVDLNSKPTPAGIEQAIQDAIKEETQTNTNDSKDLGGMQTDKGITKSPIE